MLEYLQFRNIEEVMKVACEMENHFEKVKEYNAHVNPRYFGEDQNNNVINFSLRSYNFFIKQKEIERELFTRCKSLYSLHSEEIENFLNYKFKNDDDYKSIKESLRRWNIFYDVDMEEFLK